MKMMKYPNVKNEINPTQSQHDVRQCMAFSSAKRSLSIATWLQPFIQKLRAINKVCVSVELVLLNRVPTRSR